LRRSSVVGGLPDEIGTTARTCDANLESAFEQFCRQPFALKLPLRDPKIVVKKAQRQLLLFSAGKLVRNTGSDGPQPVR